MIDTVKRMLGLGRKPTGTKLIVSCEKLEKRVALLENNRLEEYTIERETDRNIVGGIYKGKVRNIEHGLKAMFVDIGFEKNAFLHFWDAIPAALDSGVESVSREGSSKSSKVSKKAAAPAEANEGGDNGDGEVVTPAGGGRRRGRGGKGRSSSGAGGGGGRGGKKGGGGGEPKITAKDIPDIYPVGAEVMVQVSKGPISNKGPRITTNISMPGRYLVLMPYSAECGISRKIDDPKERDRLRQILRELDLPDGMGVIMRTAGQGQRARHFVRDLSLLVEQWEDIEAGMKEKPAPAELFREPDLIDRTVRDFLTDEVDEVLVDDLVAFERMEVLTEQISKRSKKRLHHYGGAQPIFDFFGVQSQIDSAFQRQVWLPCGGYIVIDETEAMIAIDVNTGRNKGAKDMDKNLLTTNLEAADEIARQLRLRNIGGLIVGDFIDMKSRKDQNAVYQRVRDHLKRDKARTHVLPISQLGLMEMTRQRAQESLASSQYMTCTHCNGRGMLKSPMTMSVEMQRALHTVMKRHLDDVHEMKVIVHPTLLQRLREDDEELLIDIERRYAGRLSFRSDPTFHHEHFVITNGVTGETLK